MNSPHIKRMNTSHGISIGDQVTWGGNKMRGEVLAIFASSLWSNGAVPMAKVHWESGSIARHSITLLTKEVSK